MHVWESWFQEVYLYNCFNLRDPNETGCDDMNCFQITQCQAFGIDFSSFVRKS